VVAAAAAHIRLAAAVLAVGVGLTVQQTITALGALAVRLGKLALTGLELLKPRQKRSKALAAVLAVAAQLARITGQATLTPLVVVVVVVFCRGSAVMAAAGARKTLAAMAVRLAQGGPMVRHNMALKMAAAAAAVGVRLAALAAVGPTAARQAQLSLARQSA